MTGGEPDGARVTMCLGTCVVCVRDRSVMLF